MSVQATLYMQLSVLETLAIDVPDVASPVLSHSKFNVGPLTLDANSTPPAAQVSSQQYTGTQTLDFTNLLVSNGSTTSGSGQKVQALLITNLSTSSGPLTIQPGSSNGLDLYGTGAHPVTIQVGATDLKYFGGNGPTIGSTAKNVTITPSSPGDKYNVAILLG